MSSLVTRNHNQTITIWRATADSYGGFTFAAPELSAGRWEDRREVFVTPQGSEEVSRAIVYLETDVAVDDFLVLDDHSGQGNPVMVPGALPVRQFLKTPSLRSLQSERKAIL